MLILSICSTPASAHNTNLFAAITFEGKVANNQQVQLYFTSPVFISEQGFDVEREDAPGVWHSLGSVKNVQNNVATNPAYFFVDPAPMNGKNFYRLKNYEADGNYTYSSIVLVEFKKGIYGLSFQNYPNPFVSTTQIKYEVGTRGPVKIMIYDINGMMLSLLVSKQDETPGSYTIQWDGSRYPAGTYIYKIITPDGTITQKMIKAR
jgi:hypothetical protein